MTSSSAQYPGPAHGGRVPNINAPDVVSFSARPHDVYVHGQPVFFDDARQDLVGRYTKTPLSEVFFSQANIANIHASIQRQVLLMSQGRYRIDKQGDDEVRIIMRSYYLMYGRNDPLQVGKELQDLNALVVGYAAGKVFSEVDFHAFYLKDLEEFAPALALPVNVKSYGSTTGELKSFF
jgi:hypothetical protein